MVFWVVVEVRKTAQFSEEMGKRKVKRKGVTARKMDMLDRESLWSDEVVMTTRVEDKQKKKPKNEGERGKNTGFQRSIRRKTELTGKQ